MIQLGLLRIATADALPFAREKLRSCLVQAGLRQVLAGQITAILSQSVRSRMPAEVTVLLDDDGRHILLLPTELARLFTDSAAIVPIAATLIPLAGVFQVFDGIQAVGIGVLRGLADTRFALVVNVLGYWVLAVPLGYWLAFSQGLGAAGLWWGLTLGLALVAIVVGLRVLWHFRRPLRPLDDAAAGR